MAGLRGEAGQSGRAETSNAGDAALPYRLVVTPIYEYVLELERRNPDRDIAVLVPELVETRWLYYLLHSQRATALKMILYRKGNRRIIVINVPWYFSS